MPPPNEPTAVLNHAPIDASRVNSSIKNLDDAALETLLLQADVERGEPTSSGDERLERLLTPLGPSIGAAAVPPPNEPTAVLNHAPIDASRINSSIKNLDDAALETLLLQADVERGGTSGSHLGPNNDTATTNERASHYETKLSPFLSMARLSAYEAGLAELGVVFVEDLAELSEDDFATLGMTRIEIARLRRYQDSQWHALGAATAS
eukprot:SAG11_NODE_1061_length_6000_cov_10.931029_3_plen_208_part_00